MRFNIPKIKIKEMEKRDKPSVHGKQTTVQKSYGSLGEAQHHFKKEYKFRVVKHDIKAVGIFFIIIILYAAILSGYVKIDTVTGDGMSPSISDGSTVIENTLSYRKKLPERGDVITAGGRVYRIIGIPGDEIAIRDGKLYISRNNKTAIIRETYESPFSFTYSYGQYDNTWKVRDNEYFVMNDNRLAYDDSRSLGTVPFTAIEGRIIAVF